MINMRLRGQSGSSKSVWIHLQCLMSQEVPHQTGHLGVWLFANSNGRCTFQIWIILIHEHSVRQGSRAKVVMRCRSHGSCATRRITFLQGYGPGVLGPFFHIFNRSNPTVGTCTKQLEGIVSLLDNCWAVLWRELDIGFCQRAGKSILASRVKGGAWFSNGFKWIF